VTSGNGCGIAAPDWSDDHVRTAQETGKIPAYDAWKTELKSGTVSLDALMNLHGAYYFADAQQKMDERIQSML
jgi:hypothetical protein